MSMVMWCSPSIQFALRTTTQLISAVAPIPDFCI